MRILMMSDSGDGLGIAQKMVEEGHEVDVYIRKKEKYDLAGLGIVNRVPAWKPVLREADLVVCDMVGFGHLSKRFQAAEKPAMSCNPFGDRMELDRDRQMKLLRNVGIRLPHTRSFNNISEARDLIEDWKEPGFVLKPSGNIETARTMMIRDIETLKWALDQYTGSQQLIVQEIINGVEISTEGWFNGSDWITGSYNHTFESKRFLHSDLGPNTGCMGNIVYKINNPERNVLVGELRKLTPFLRSIDFRGPIDLNAIVNESGTYALELTTRLGYDAIEAYNTMWENTNIGEFFNMVARGKADLLSVGRQYGAAVRLFVPPYPYADADKDESGMPVHLPSNLHFFYLTDIHRNANVDPQNVYRWSASDGVLLKVTAASNDLEETIDMVYNRVGAVKANGLGYRVDIGSRVARDIDTLRKLGVL